MLVSSVTQFERVNLLSSAHVESTNEFGAASIVSPALDHLLDATMVENVQEFGAPTIEPQPATELTPAHVVNAQAFGAHTIEIVTASAFTTWNPADKSANIALTNSNKTATQSSGGDCAVRGVHVKTSGKWYFELTMNPVNGGNTGAGLANAAAVLGSIPTGPDKALIHYKGGNVYLNNGGALFNNGPLSAGDVLCIAYDAGAHRAWTKLNSGVWNANPTYNPDTNTGGVDVSAIDAAGLMPAWAGGASGDVAVANFGASAFVHAVPTGFTGWSNV